MKRIFLSVLAISLMFQSCSNDNDEVVEKQLVAPATYKFTRDGISTVSYSGQTTRLKMGDELSTALKDNTKTEADLDGMFTNIGDKFSDAELNSSGKDIRSKIAASYDYFSANSTDANAIRSDFDAWIKWQVDDVFPNFGVDAEAGVAGKILEINTDATTSTRYVNAKGLEYDQAIVKGLIGALAVDQTINNYLSPAVLDAGTNKEDNNNGIVVAGKNYTIMEHKWDEAYGYVFGLNADPENPNTDLGADNFLNKYLKRVEDDADFTGIADDIFNAFKLGRAAIVAKNYTVRDQQAEIIKEKLSVIIGKMAVFYLQVAKSGFDNNMGAALHDLSEGYGFICSLQFTRKPNTETPYFSKAEVEAFLATLMEGDGFWDISPEALDTISNQISARFPFTTQEAK